ncbi:hypothetical protein C8Z91_02175 [Paenibacillus elgii]|uniref:DUF3953 domain-containing protein n=1 Tax=Paenibacillus elgii TaxID=189691 RepID=A0A2T6G920_9BACL|nr:hypothetical protein C8Z91_02175 [Paenibacillus elgii]
MDFIERGYLMNKNKNIFTIISRIFAFIVIIVSCYSLMQHDNYRYIQYTQLGLALMFLFSSLSEFKRENKKIAIMNLSVSLFVFFVFFAILLTRK